MKLDKIKVRKYSPLKIKRIVNIEYCWLLMIEKDLTNLDEIRKFFNSRMIEFYIRRKHSSDNRFYEIEIYRLEKNKLGSRFFTC